MRKENISYILSFSARSREALDNTSSNVINYLKEHNEIDIADASWTLQKGRRAFEYRKAFISSRNDIDSNTLHVCRNAGKIDAKQNLVIVLPGIQDLTDTWNMDEMQDSPYNVLKTYEHVVGQILEMLPASTAENVLGGNKTDTEVNCFRAFISGYASAKMLIEIGLCPTALAGEGIAELAAMVCAGAVSMKDAIDIIRKNGELPTYEELYEKYELRKKQIPVIRKAGKKAKQHIDNAVVIKLGSIRMENDITRRCMTDVSEENVICMIENDMDNYINNIYNLIGKLWCKGIEINWTKVSGDAALKRIALPTYVFDKREFESDVIFGVQNPSPAKLADSVPVNEEIILDPSEVLKKLWHESLGVTDIKKGDDFFELGGCSLGAIMLSAKIKEALKVEFPLSEIFYHSTFEKMDKYICSHMKQKSEDVIEKLGVQEYYEASSAQKRMYAVNEMIGDSIPYNFAVKYSIKGKIDKEKIENCFSKIVQRHEAFRTRFDLVDGEVVQIIEDSVEFKVNFQTIEKENLDKAIDENIKPFDLEKAPLLRVTFFSLNEDEHVMVLDMHHIISDQSSLDVLLKEIGAIYEGQELPELEIQYKDFAKWQNDFIRSGKVKKQLEYWKKEFEGDLSVLDLYTDYDRPDIMGYEGGRVHFAFEDAINSKIFDFTKEQGITPYMFIIAALNIMLWRYTNQTDIVIGTAIAGRRHAKLESIVGMFVNTLAIKSKIDENAAIKNYLQYTKDKMVCAYDNQDLQFDVLVEELGIPKNLSRNPLFDILFNYINIGTDDVEIEGLSLVPYDDGIIDVKFDISFTLEEKDQKFYMDIDYSKTLYKEETIHLMGNRLLHIISQMLEHGNSCLKDIDMMTEEERQWLVKTVNQTASDEPSDKTLLEIFEQCVRDNPDATAIEWMEEKISYRQLNNMSNQLAKKLAERNIGYQEKVAMLLQRSHMQVVSMLGIMKLGAVYVPIDPKYPQERIDYILQDCRSRVIVTEHSLEEKAGREIEKFLVDAEENALDMDCDTGIESECTPKAFNCEDLIYIIYTSGSTGTPKGAMIKHKSVLHNVKNTNYIQINQNDRVMQLSNYVFDLSVFDIYSALLNGACLVIIPREMVFEVPLLVDFINDKKVSIFCISTALFHMLADWKAESIKDVRKVIVCGEQLSLPHAKKVVKAIGKGKVINAYGPSETAVFSTYYPVDEIEDTSVIPIGYPLSNVTVYVVDEKKELVPINVAGELCIGGDGIGIGYLNRDELTKEKYIRLDAAGGEMVYCSGDRVMWNSNKELVFLGRKDFQTKIRGFRIELGEVERQIENIDGIKSVIVITNKDNLGMLYMTAYYTVKDYRQKDKYDEKFLRNALSLKLPEYMIPSKFMLLEELPLNFNGKVDRKALPKVTDNVQKASVKDEPRTIIEHKILEAMKKILGNADIGIKDDFFLCGGQSIKAIALVKDLSVQGVEIKVNEIFQYRTAERIAACIAPITEELTPSEESENPVIDIELNKKQINGLVKHVSASMDGISDIITASESGMTFSLSPIQSGHMKKGSDHCGFITNINFRIPENRIKDAIVNVICKNQLLHCTLVEVEGEQKWCEYEVSGIEAVIGNYLAYIDISMYTEGVRENIITTLYDEIMLRNYSEDELLWRVCVVKESSNKYLVIWGADHLIFDVMSGEVIKHQIEKELGKSFDDNLQTIRSYREYVEVLEKGPTDITEEELIEKFNLEKWSKSNSKVMKVRKADSSQLKRNVELVIPFLNNEQVDIWQYAFDLVSEILRGYTKTETIPFAVVNYGRSYGDEDFYNCVGEFLDIIPIIGSKKQKTSVETVIRLCKDYCVNFMTLLGLEQFKKAYPKVNELVGKYYYNQKEYFDLIMYNFQGLVTAKEKEVFVNNKKDNSLSRMSVTVNYDNENLYIEFEDVLGLDEEKIREYAKKELTGGKK